MKKIVIATRNKHKFEEIQAIFQKLNTKQEYQLLSLDDIESLPKNFDVEETEKTYEGNAIKKAKEYSEKIGMLVVADDSGLEVRALDNRPGIYSGRYGPDDWTQKRLKLLSEMENVPDKARNAQFVCVMAIYDPQSKKLRTCKGEYKGNIAKQIRGDNGFGFDPIFYNKDLGKTNAEMTSDEKNSVSHRFLTLKEVYKVLKSEF